MALGVVVLGAAVTISAGTWIGGVPALVRDHLHEVAGAFSIVMVGYAGSLWLAAAGGFAAACGQSSAQVQLVSAAQDDVPDALLGRLLGMISLVHRVAHAKGLLLVAPLFVVLAPQDVFAGAAVALASSASQGPAAALSVSSRRAA